MTEVLRWKQIGREKLKDLIFKNPGVLLPGLIFIDTQLGTEEEGIIDFFGKDKSGRLVIVNFDTKENDDLIVCSLSQAQWLNKTKSLLKRLYFSENVDFNQPTLILLIAPVFSDKSRSAAKQLSNHEIKFIEYRYLAVNGADAVIFDEIFCNKKLTHKISLIDRHEKDAEPILDMQASACPKAQEQEKPLAVSLGVITDDSPPLGGIVLTNEEIAEFMSFDKTIGKEKL